MRDSARPIIAIVVLMATCTAAISKAAGAFMSQTLPILEHEVESVGGTVPSWLQGTLVRNVPNTYEMGKDQVWSWTDAFPSIHLLKFNGSNTVLHTARDLMSNSVAKAVEENGIPFVLFMTPKNGGDLLHYTIASLKCTHSCFQICY